MPRAVRSGVTGPWGGPCRVALIAALLLAAGCGGGPREAQPATAPAPVVAPAGVRRAILASFDGLAESRALETVPASAIPTFRALFANAACARGARPAFPSVTAPGHASLWTGAYGNVNGIAANTQPVLPRTDHTLLDRESGYADGPLRAEPLWITAAASGLPVAAHHVTQAPRAPGYRGVDGPEATLDSARAAAAALLAREGVTVMNGYNVMLAPAQVLTERDVPPRPAAGWRNLERLTSSVAPREVAWAVGADTVFALLHGGEVYDRVLIAPTRDVAAGTLARLAPVERAPVAGRELARHFAPGVELRTARGLTIVTARLFELSPDGARFRLFVPEVRLIEGNDAELVATYLRAIGGWYGNGAVSVLRSGGFGPTVYQGGDGTAEWRYLESVELATRQFVRGSAWLWQRGPRLQLDYYPIVDEADHEWFGLVTREAAGYDPAVAETVQVLRARAWSLADERLRQLRALVAGDTAAVLLVGGDHGMRAYWRFFRVNAVLRDAGLLAVDAAGTVDLSRTRALSPAGYYVVVNRTAWKGGVVSEAEVPAVLAAVERALREARGPDGAPIVTRIWRASDPGADTLGIGGPTGGDLYYELAPGYALSAELVGPVTSPAPRAVAGHSYPSVAPDMQTVLCLWGDAVGARRIGPARTVDAAPTVAEWLGIRPPAHAVGRSLLGELLGR